MSTLSIEDVKKLNIQDNDILLVPEHTSFEDLKRLGESVRPAKSIVIFCGALDKISEKEMNAAGWYRK